MIRISLWSFVIACLSLGFSATAQETPIGQWSSHLPYKRAMGVATDGIRAFVATEEAFYTYHRFEEELKSYSKVNGMSDQGMATLAYDPLTETVVLAYTNGNLDLFDAQGFTNIPDLKQRMVTGTKNIHQILCSRGYAYICTDIGILVLDLKKKEIRETYSFYQDQLLVPITGLAATEDHFYAATGKGLYSSPRHNPRIPDFKSWTALDSLRSFNAVAWEQDRVFALSRDTLFVSGPDSLIPRFHSEHDLTGLHAGSGGVWVIEWNDQFSGCLRKFDTQGALIDSVYTEGHAQNLVELSDGKLWIADKLRGLKERSGTSPIHYNTPMPNGPAASTSFDLFTSGQGLLVAHGGYDDKWHPLGTAAGFSVYQDQLWTNYSVYEYPPFGDSMMDISSIMQGPDGSLYAGSFRRGLFILRPDGEFSIVQEPLDRSITAADQIQIGGMVMDRNGYLWVTVYGGDHELASLSPSGQWTEYAVPYSRPLPHAATEILIDDLGQKWYVSPLGGGVIVYDDKGTPEHPGDDTHRQLRAGKGVGGLPDNTVYTLVKDRRGALWIGTANGIGIVHCPGQVISGQCEAELRIVQYDQFAGYLFQNEQVRAMAVDGANRKWVGTNHGVWLLSESGDEILHRFTEKNSPLPSDRIQKIRIDPQTGVVFIGTEKGLVSYRGSATEPSDRQEEILVFPNPVPSGYSGPIAFRELSENADLRITDLSGQLIYRTRAFGGQAVWDGKDYTGNRPQSGVYLLFVTDAQGRQKGVGKMVFHH